MIPQLTERFGQLSQQQSDINEHLPTLKGLAKDCATVVELGTRSGVSTVAFLAAQPKRLLCVDISHMQHVKQELQRICGDTLIEFVNDNDLNIEIPVCELLFIDTYHTYTQLIQELEKHGDRSTKYIVLHDTVTFGRIGEDSFHKGLMDAVSEWLGSHAHWHIEQHYTNNNGLLVIERDPLKKHNKRSKYE